MPESGGLHMAQGAEGRRTMNIGDIAQALNISKTTVSRAISGNGRVNEATRERVLSYIRAHNYRPNGLAKGLAENKTYNIALVIPSRFSSLDLPFLRKTMSAIYEVAAQNDYDVLLLMVGERDTAPMQRLLDNRKIDGAILTRTLENDPLVPLLKADGLPFVAIGRTDDPDVLQVDNDQIGGCRELTSLLLMKGMRRIALLGGSMLYTVNKSRLEGFQQAYARAGLTPEPALLHLELESEMQRIHAIEQTLTQNPECILCMDEDVAALVMRTLKSKGVPVPGQVRVASLYDSEDLQDMTPAVSAVQFDAFQLGYSAARLLLSALSGSVEERQIQLGFQVVLRDSTKA